MMNNSSIIHRLSKDYSLQNFTEKPPTPEKGPTSPVQGPGDFMAGTVPSQAPEGVARRLAGFLKVSAPRPQASPRAEGNRR